MYLLVKTIYLIGLFLACLLAVSICVNLQLLVVSTSSEGNTAQLYIQTINYLVFNIQFDVFSNYTIIEAIHLAEVKNLFAVLNFLVLGEVVFVLSNLKIIKLFRFKRSELQKLFVGMLVTLLLLVFLWQPIFTLMHQLVFTNMFWQLDPSKHVLINYFLPNAFLILFMCVVALWFAMIMLVNYIVDSIYFSKTKVEFFPKN